eukprot:6708095-Alexandrium_andersonii.AAC.1
MEVAMAAPLACELIFALCSYARCDFHCAFPTGPGWLLSSAKTNRIAIAVFALAARGSRATAAACHRCHGKRSGPARKA